MSSLFWGLDFFHLLDYWINVRILSFWLLNIRIGSFLIAKFYIHDMARFLKFLDSNGIFIFACDKEHKPFLEGSCTVLDGFKILEGKFLSLEYNFGFLSFVNLSLHGFYKILDWCCGLYFVWDDLVCKIFNFNIGMELLFRAVIEFNKIRDFTQWFFGLHFNKILRWNVLNGLSPCLLLFMQNYYTEALY